LPGEFAQHAVGFGDCALRFAQRIGRLALGFLGRGKALLQRIDAAAQLPEFFLLRAGCRGSGRRGRHKQQREESVTGKLTQNSTNRSY